jgi:hypothetical protein
MAEHWAASRLARFGFLIGIGWNAKQVAEDPVVATTPSNAHAKASRLGLSFRTAAAQREGLNLAGPRLAYFDAAARRRGLSREGLLHRLLNVVADERMIDNILDDLDETPAP